MPRSLPSLRSLRLIRRLIGSARELPAYLRCDPAAFGSAGYGGLDGLHRGAHLPPAAESTGGQGGRDQLRDLCVGEWGGQVAVEDRTLGALPHGLVNPSRPFMAACRSVFRRSFSVPMEGKLLWRLCASAPCSPSPPVRPPQAAP